MFWKSSSLDRLAAMLIKEFGQLSRDLPILFILIWAFTGAIYIAGHTISMEIRNFPVVVYDLSQSLPSRDLTQRLRKPYFKILRQAETEQQWINMLDRGTASLALIIPPEFERDLASGDGKFQVISDGSLSMSATIASAHIARIAGEFNLELVEEKLGNLNLLSQQIAQVDVRLRTSFNPNVNSAWFTSLLELFNIITMVSMLLTAAAMVREKSQGTVEQLLVTPLRPMELFLAKILPTVAVVLGLSTVSLLVIVQGVFDTPIRGNLLLFYSVTAIYSFSIASLGITVAVLARNIAQAMMLLLLILFPMLFLSGATTPPESMAPWMQWASLLSPMRYFIDFGYQVLFKGNGLEYVWQDILGILVLGSGMFSFSLWRYRRLVS